VDRRFLRGATESSLKEEKIDGKGATLTRVRSRGSWFFGRARRGEKSEGKRTVDSFRNGLSLAVNQEVLGTKGRLEDRYRTTPDL